MKPEMSVAVNLCKPHTPLLSFLRLGILPLEQELDSSPLTSVHLNIKVKRLCKKGIQIKNKKQLPFLTIIEF